MVDADVPAYWQSLGLPGLIDVHVHFMPDQVMRKVWAFFAAVGPPPWPIVYQLPEDQRLAHLRSLGVRAFPSLLYAHKPAMAAWLNEWAREFAAGQDDVLMTATIYPEPGVTAYLDEALRAGTRIVKVHVQVGAFDPRDPLLDEAWGMLADAGVPVITHAGNGPHPGSFTGPGPIGEVLDRHPTLAMVAAHMGMPDHDAFLDLAERYDNVHVDTTMCFTDFVGDADEGRRLVPRLQALSHKVVFGSDYPNIPHPYAHQLEALARLGLGDDWMRAVCWDNPARLLAIPATG